MALKKNLWCPSVILQRLRSQPSGEAKQLTPKCECRRASDNNGGFGKGGYGTKEALKCKNFKTPSQMAIHKYRLKYTLGLQIFNICSKVYLHNQEVN